MQAETLAADNYVATGFLLTRSGQVGPYRPNNLSRLLGRTTPCRLAELIATGSWWRPRPSVPSLDCQRRPPLRSSSSSSGHLPGVPGVLAIHYSVRPPGSGPPRRGPYRVVYQVDDDRGVVGLLRIHHRVDVDRPR